MNEITMTRREAKQARIIADRKALYAKFIKPIKAVTVVSLVSAFFLTGSVSAMAATSEPSLGIAQTADQMSGTPSLGTALTEAQMNAALNGAPSQTITGATGTNDGLNIDVNMSDASTELSVNTLADDGNGNYKVEVVATGAEAGSFNNLVGSKFYPSFGANDATITVTGVNGNIVSLDVALVSVPTVTPTFTATGSSLGAAPVAPKGTSVAVDDTYTLDVAKGLTGTVNVRANDTAADGYSLESVELVDPITEKPISNLNTGHATLTIVNDDVAIEALDDGFTGFVNVSTTEKEVWSGPGVEPAGWTGETITSLLSIHIIGKDLAAPVATDCTVPVAPSGGSGFSVPFASSGSTGLTCNLVAAADAVSIAADAMEASVPLGANDVTTNSSYSIDPSSIVVRAPDGSFAKHVIYPGQYEVSVDPATGIATPKRIGTYSEEPQILYQVSEFKLDSNGNKVVGGKSSALLTMNFASVTTPENPVTVPEEPVTVPETPVTVPVVPVVPAPVGDTTNVPVPAPVSGNNSRPFVNIGNTSASIPASKAASVAPKGTDNNGILAVELALIALGAAGAFVIKARHRKTQKSDVRA